MKALIQSIIEAIKQIFGFGEKLAENKSQKIPLQKEAIKEKAETIVIRQDNKQHKLKKVIPKREIVAKIELLELKFRDFKRVKKAAYSLIESGEQITAIGIDDGGVKIVCLSGREKVVKIS